MPIEVRELVIKATIVQDGSGAQGGAGTPVNNAVTPNEELINLCVEKVLEIIKDKNER